MTDTHRRYIDLQVGDPAPVFHQRSLSNPRYVFDTAAGRYLVLCFFGSAADPEGAAQIAAAGRHGKVFNDNHASFFGVSTDPDDEAAGRLKEKIRLSLSARLRREGQPAGTFSPPGRSRRGQAWRRLKPEP